MKEKIKKVLKNRIFIFVMSAILFSVVGVSAATYFESGAVTYDNTESGLTSTNVQGAIDELHSMCVPITSLPSTSDDLKDKVVTSGDGLYKDEYEDGRYFYKGANPNNYIRFNNELWRILSIENDGSMKIINTNGFGYSYNSGNGAMGWDEPANLNGYLNLVYYKNLSESAKKLIISHDWSIGAIKNDAGLAFQIRDENSNKWNDDVGVITVSEYIRANSNKSSCGTLDLMDQNRSICKNSNWLFLPDSWFINHIGNFVSNYIGYMYYPAYLDSNGAIYGTTEYDYTRAAYPVVYIYVTTNITGTGTQSDPYRVE